MLPTPDDLTALLSRQPMSVGDVGLAVAASQGHDPAQADGVPVGQWLASTGLSLSGLQHLLDQLVREGRVQQVRGGQLWDLELPTVGTKAGSRYYLRPLEL